MKKDRRLEIGLYLVAYTYTYNNQLLTETAPDANITYAYDLNGNLVLRTDDANNTTGYTWDWRNLLVSVSEPAGNTLYEYNGDGARINKTQNGVKTEYINDVALSLVQVLLETDANGIIQATYTYGNDLISMNRADANSYYHYDGLGSTRQLTGSTGAVSKSYTYDSFGNLIASSGATTNAYGFTGEQHFGEADSLVFLRARYYSPNYGRFMSRDPILAPIINFKGHLWWLDTLKFIPNRLAPYSYCVNNPVNMLDPKGLKPQKPGCDIIGDIWPGFNKNRCTRACCDQHDDCYAKNNCNMGSWLPCVGSDECDECNNEVAWCFAGCAISPGLW